MDFRSKSHFYDWGLLSHALKSRCLVFLHTYHSMRVWLDLLMSAYSMRCSSMGTVIWADTMFVLHTSDMSSLSNLHPVKSLVTHWQKAWHSALNREHCNPVVMTFGVCLVTLRSYVQIMRFVFHVSLMFSLNLRFNCSTRLLFKMRGPTSDTRKETSSSHFFLMWKKRFWSRRSGSGENGRGKEEEKLKKRKKIEKKKIKKKEKSS